MQIIGKSDIDFTTKEGQQVKGTRLYVGYKEEHTLGMKAEQLFVRDGIEIPKDLKLNSQVEVSFNNRGKVESINLI